MAAAAGGGSAGLPNFPNVPTGPIHIGTPKTRPKKTIVGELNRYKAGLEDHEFKGLLSVLIYKLIRKFRFQTKPKVPREFLTSMETLRTQLKSHKSDDLIYFFLHNLQSGLDRGELGLDTKDVVLNLFDESTKETLMIRAEALKMRRNRRKTRRISKKRKTTRRAT